MNYVGKHKINGKEIYEKDGKHYHLENGEYLPILELTKEQKKMLELLHSPEANRISAEALESIYPKLNPNLNTKAIITSTGGVGFVNGFGDEGK